MINELLKRKKKGLMSNTYRDYQKNVLNNILVAIDYD